MYNSALDELNDSQRQRLKQFRRLLGAYARWSDLMRVHRQTGHVSPPTFITKNVSFKTRKRGVYRLYPDDGALCNDVELKKFLASDRRQDSLG